MGQRRKQTRRARAITREGSPVDLRELLLWLLTRRPTPKWTPILPPDRLDDFLRGDVRVQLGYRRVTKPSQVRSFDDQKFNLIDFTCNRGDQDCHRDALLFGICGDRGRGGELPPTPWTIDHFGRCWSSTKTRDGLGLLLWLAPMVLRSQQDEVTFTAIDRWVRGESLYAALWTWVRHGRWHVASATEPWFDTQKRCASLDPWHRNSDLYIRGREVAKYAGQEPGAGRRRDGSSRAARSGRDSNADLGGRPSKHHRKAPRVMKLRVEGFSHRAIGRMVNLPRATVQYIIANGGKYENHPRRLRHRKRSGG